MNFNHQTQPKIFYGWWIVLGGFSLTAVSSAFSYYGFGIFFNPLLEEFGWNAAVLGGALSLSRLESGFMAPLVGYLVDRIGPRKVMLVGVTLTGTGYILLSQTTSPLYFYVVFLLLVQGGASAGMGSPPRIATANWFRRKRGTALGLVTLGLSVGGIFARPLAEIITNLGWRTALIIGGVLIWIVGYPVSLIMRQRPEQFGYAPDGDVPETMDPISDPISSVANPTSGNISPSKPSISSSQEVNFSPMDALKTRAFWTITLMFTSRQLVAGTVALFLVPLLQERGMSLTTAASMVSIMALVGMPGRVGFGWLGDQFDKRKVLAFCFMMQSIGLILFTSLGGMLGLGFFLTLYAATYAGVNPLIPAIQGEYFGRQYFGTIRGLMTPISMLAVVSGPFIMTLIHDLSGSYEPAFIILAGVNLFALVFILITKKPDPTITFSSTD